MTRITDIVDNRAAEGFLAEHGLSLPTFDEEVRITYIHEFGHYLGLNESELESRGLG